MSCLVVLETAILAKTYAHAVELHFQVKGLVARAEKHGHFGRLIDLKETGNLLGHDRGLAEVGQAADDAHRSTARIAGKEILAIAFGRMPEQTIGHIQDGFGGAVIFFELDDLRIRILPREFQDVFYRSPAKRVNGLRLVAHGHN